MRQYISQENLDSSGLLSVSGKDFRYLHSVLRLSAGDMIFVRLPSGDLQPMTVCKIDEKAKKITLQVCDTMKNKSDGEESSGEAGKNLPKVENQPSFVCGAEFFLFMAVPKSSKFDQIVRQATECGVSKIIPVKTEFSQVGAEKMNFRSERFGRIIKEARQQSGSAVETNIANCVNLDQACEIWKKECENLSDSERLAIVLYERNDSTVTIREAGEKWRKLQNSADSANPQKIALFCGSEGGLSPSEVKLLANAGFVPVHLKTNILRCETAALYGIAAIQSLL